MKNVKSCPFCREALEYLGESADPDAGTGSLLVFDRYHCNRCNEDIEVYKTKLRES